jgi:predicted nucleotidyltransferase
VTLASKEVRAEVLAITRQVAGIVRRVTGDPTYRVVLFGSWATERASERSDIDIGIVGPRPVDPVAMGDIREACDALPTLHTVDLVDLAATAPSLRTVALAQGLAVEADGQR